jgi:dCMP deaminase
LPSETLPYGVNPQHQRPDWDEYFLGLLPPVSRRATCERNRVGALLVKQNRVLGTAYMDAPPGQLGCDEVGHQLLAIYYPDGEWRQHCVRALSAELHLIAQAAREGVRVEGSTLYVVQVPSLVSAGALVVAGVKRVVARKKSAVSDLGWETLERGGVEILIQESKI